MSDYSVVNTNANKKNSPSMESHGAYTLVSAVMERLTCMNAQHPCIEAVERG